MGTAPSIEARAVASSSSSSSPPAPRAGRGRTRRSCRPRRGKARLLGGRNAAPRKPSFDGLPREILASVQGFLLGVDLFTLSHVNRRLYHALANAQLWNARMANYDFNPAVYQRYLQETAKMRYAQGRSLKFPGVSMDSKRLGHHDRGDSVALPRIVRMFHLDPIAIDVWFCLLPPHASDDGRRVFTGGVLFGSQSEAAFARHAPSQFEHLIHVDADRNLYCSLMWQKPVVASKLAFNRWYHVAISFNGEEERVYVSGKLMHVDASRQMTPWSDLPFAQLGTGMLGARSPGRPTPDFAGWYGFFGLIDDFRIWNQALSAEQVHKLARGEFVKTLPSFRLKRVVGSATCGRVHSVRCSRPVERVAEIVPLRSKKKTLHQWLKKVRRSSTESASCISISA